jgi:mono/diheme cytochrome c family protein
MLYRRVTLITVALLSGLSFAGVSLSQDLPPGDGHDVVQTVCMQCHGLEVIVAQRRSPDEWRDVVGRMVGSGANLTDVEYAKVVEYLSTKLGPEGVPPPASPDPVEH